VPELARHAPALGAGEQAVDPAHLDPSFLDDVIDLVDRASQPADVKLAGDTRAAIALPVALEGVPLDVRRKCRRGHHGYCEQD
jgi:hypothetical protein